MRVVTIDNWDTFVSLEQVWKSVHSRDPEAHYFLSWQWLAEVFRANPGRWRVLTVQPVESADPVCILPLAHHTRWSESRQQLTTELSPAGRMSWAQYTGFVCLPEHEQTAISAIASELSAQPWCRLSFKYDSCERRLHIFLSSLAGADFRVSQRPVLINGGEVDNLVCPQIELPDDFDTYLQTRLSANTRQKLRRSWRRFEQNDALCITDATPASFDQDLDHLLDLWLKAWAPVRGRGSAKRAVKKYREIIGQSQAIDAARICTLWQGDRPVGGLCSIIDRRSGHLYFIVAGRDETADVPTSGMLLHAHNIRLAIEEGLRTYDFCHGNEPYKYSFGSTDRRLSNIEVVRRSGSEIGLFDPAHVGEARDERLA